MRAIWISSPLLALVLVFLAFGLAAAGEAAVSDQTPPAAPGFKTPAEVMQAINSGQVKLIEQPIGPPPGVLKKENIKFCDPGSSYLLLDLYLPEKIAKPVPLLIFIHGGSWKSGFRDDCSFLAIAYAAKGYAAATISYRLSTEAPFPAAVQDVKCAVRWLRANAGKYSIDPEHFAAIGSSVGGHLALMVGYSSSVAELEGTGGNQNVSSAVQGVVNLYGPSDLTDKFAQKSRSVKQFLGSQAYEAAPDLYRRASPITYVNKSCPPTLILHGTIDADVPIEQSDKLVAKLKSSGVPYVYDRLEGWPHMMDMAVVVNQRCQFFIDQFLAKYLPIQR